MEVVILLAVHVQSKLAEVQGMAFSPSLSFANIFFLPWFLRTSHRVFTNNDWGRSCFPFSMC